MQSYDEWMRIAEQQQRGTSGHDNDGCLAVFYTVALEDKKASELEGRPIYNSVPFVEIRVPGDKNSVVKERVKDEHKLRWPKAWEAYLAKRTGPVDGTPIEQFPLLTVEQVATLRHCGVHTVEQLAKVSDGNLRNLGPGAMQLRERAKQHLLGPGETEKALRETIQRQEVQISDLQAKLQQLMATTSGLVEELRGDDEDDEMPVVRRGPGRPRKVAA